MAIGTTRFDQNEKRRLDILISSQDLSSGLPTQDGGCKAQGVDVALERLDLGVLGRDGRGHLLHGGGKYWRRWSGVTETDPPVGSEPRLEVS